MDHTKPASSRATATQTLLTCTPREDKRAKRPHKRCWAFQAWLRTGSRGARIAFFLLFLIPGIPKDILCYAAGITPMGFPYFAAVSTLGRLPGIAGSALIGSAAASRRWVLAGIVAGAALVLKEEEADGAALLEAVGGLLGDRTRLAEMGRCAGKLAQPDAAASIAGHILRRIAAAGMS